MKIFLSMILALIYFNSSGQNVTNSSFESWQIGGFVQKPTGWSTSNDFSAQWMYSVAPDTSAYDSNMSAKIETVEVGFGSMPYAGFVVNGFMLADGNNDFEKIENARLLSSREC